MYCPDSRAFPRRAHCLPVAVFGGLLVSLSASAEEPDSRSRPNASLVLPTLKVQGEQALGETTEDSGSYTTGAMSTAIGLPLSIRETPQSVSVVTRQRIEDQGLATTAEILASAPGISYTRSDSNRLAFSARGFAIDNFQFDGLASPINNLWNFGATDMDSAIYDRVEIVRGSTGLLTGAGNPSAAVNFVRKKPLADFAISGSAGPDAGASDVATSTCRYPWRRTAEWRRGWWRPIRKKTATPAFWKMTHARSMGSSAPS